MPRYLFKRITLFWSLLLLGLSAQATIIGGNITGGTTGINFEKLLFPFSATNEVGNDNFNNLTLYGFDESQNVTVTGSPLQYDVTVGGSFNNGSPANSGSLGVGTVVASHYIFFDPLNSARVIGNVEFDSDILAVIVGTTNLDNSDYLAHPGVTYLNPTLRGLETGPDKILNVTQREVFIDFTASSPGDYIRVLTGFSPAAAVPEPTPLVLMGLILAGLGLVRRMRE